MNPRKIFVALALSLLAAPLSSPAQQAKRRTPQDQLSSIISYLRGG